jgi:hypothetical protein
VSYSRSGQLSGLSSALLRRISSDLQPSMLIKPPGILQPCLHPYRTQAILCAEQYSQHVQSCLLLNPADQAKPCTALSQP